MKQIILLLSMIAIFSSASASIDNFKAYLDYANRSSTTKVELDQWLNLGTLSRSLDLSELIVVAEREKINLVVAQVNYKGQADRIYLTRASHYPHYNNPVMTVNMYNMASRGYGENGKLVGDRAYGDFQIPLSAGSGISEYFMYIPANGKMQGPINSETDFSNELIRLAKSIPKNK